jgi:hypothetical protein
MFDLALLEMLAAERGMAAGINLGYLFRGNVK